MKSKEKKKDALAILGKTLLYIVAVAMAFAFIILAWEKYDWLPTVKEIIRGLIIPILLGGLTVFLLRHEFDVLKDKWKPFVQFVIFLTGTLVFVNAGIIAQRACTKVMKVDNITELPNEEIKRMDYLQVERVEPDTNSCNYLLDDALIPSRGGQMMKLLLYQVCPLKDKDGVFVCTRTKETHDGQITNRVDAAVFVCTRTKETHHARWASQSKLEQWKKDFVDREKGSIKKVALSAHFFKVLHPSDDFEPYQTIAANCTTHHGTISPENLVLLQICLPDTIKGWTTCSIFSVLCLWAFLCLL